MPKEETNPEKIKRLDKEIYEHFEKMNGHDTSEKKSAETSENHENYSDQIKRLEKELSDQVNEMNSEDREAFDQESRKFRQENDES